MSLKFKPGRALLAALLVLLAIPVAIALGAPPTASACPPQGCHQEPDDPPPPHPPSPPQPKYRIFIDTLRAYETEDGFEDEAYIHIKGSKVWGPYGTNALQMQYPNVSHDVVGPIWVTLFTQDDANYTMGVRVLRLS